MGNQDLRQLLTSFISEKPISHQFPGANYMTPEELDNLLGRFKRNPNANGDLTRLEEIKVINEKFAKLNIDDLEEMLLILYSIYFQLSNLTTSSPKHNEHLETLTWKIKFLQLCILQQVDESTPSTCKYHKVSTDANGDSRLTFEAEKELLSDNITLHDIGIEA